MRKIKHLTIVALVVFTCAMCAVSTAAKGENPVESKVVASEKSAPVTTVAPANAEIIQPSLAAEDVISLSGRATCALSICEPTFTPTPDTGIDRMRPAHQPPN